MKAHFVDQGIGVILGEYGVISRVNVADHETYRRYWNEYITASALEHGLVPVYWDNGWAGNFGFALFDRHNGAQIEPELIQRSEERRVGKEGRTKLNTWHCKDRPTYR